MSRLRLKKVCLVWVGALCLLVSWNACAQSATLIDKAVEVSLGDDGAVNWSQTFKYNGQDHLTAILYYIHYNDGSEKTAGIVNMTMMQSNCLNDGPRNLDVIVPTTNRGQNKSYTCLRTSDGKLEIDIDSSLDGENLLLSQNYVVKNISDSEIKGVRLYVYSMLHGLPDYAAFDMENDILYFHKSDNDPGSKFAGVTGSVKSAGHSIGMYARLFNYMLIDVHNNRDRWIGHSPGLLSWDLGTLASGENQSVAVIHGMGSTYDDLRGKLSRCRQNGKN